MIRLPYLCFPGLQFQQSQNFLIVTSLVNSGILHRYDLIPPIRNVTMILTRSCWLWLAALFSDDLLQFGKVNMPTPLCARRFGAGGKPSVSFSGGPSSAQPQKHAAPAAPSGPRDPPKAPGRESLKGKAAPVEPRPPAAQAGPGKAPGKKVLLSRKVHLMYTDSSYSA